AGEAKQTSHAELFGRSREKRERFRQRVLQVSLEDLKRVADSYLRADRASTAVITNSDGSAEVQSLGLQTVQL
ncbi:MAG: hypothetical protein P8Y45_17105, partial [Exilibacterium sp.]